ncbi:MULTISPECIES: hypothetical protein [unclassified Streptomyces]|uniref:hypothetical protein n=1 Tax=unclassified Streptomyces TaxID=2593676 RepID=UPI0008238F1A|nr:MULTISPECIES: hypothetical protein [unclassified Streptomyces]SCK31167.1 hypothetical protein YW7DRAFT_02464 [Streptomyces sp. AmelKG-E11A]
MLVPLPGHSAGHAGVAVRDGDGRWLLHAGDAYTRHGEIEHPPPRSHPALDPVQQGAQTDAAARVLTRDRLRGLRRDHADEVTVLSAHDSWEFARLTARAGSQGGGRPGRGGGRCRHWCGVRAAGDAARAASYAGAPR